MYIRHSMARMEAMYILRPPPPRAGAYSLFPRTVRFDFFMMNHVCMYIRDMDHSSYAPELQS